MDCWAEKKSESYLFLSEMWQVTGIFYAINNYVKYEIATKLMGWKNHRGVYLPRVNIESYLTAALERMRNPQATWSKKWKEKW